MTTCVCPEPRTFNVTSTCGLWKEQVSTTSGNPAMNGDHPHLLTTRTMLLIDFVSVTVGNSHIPGFHANKSMDASWTHLPNLNLSLSFQTSSPNQFNHQYLPNPISWILINDTHSHTYSTKQHTCPQSKKRQKMQSKDQYSWKFR